MLFGKMLQLCTAATLLLSTMTSASQLFQDYNLILTGDYNYKGGEVEGRTLLGGDLNAAGHSPTFSTREASIAFKETLTVTGDINASNINQNAGSITYGGNLNLNGNINLNGGGATVQSVTAGDQAQMHSYMGSISQQLRNESQYLSTLNANADLNGRHLSYSGNENVAVFDLDYQEVFAQNSSLSLDAGSAETVIINVSGDAVAVAGGVNLTGNGFSVQGDENNLGASNILWNFHQANSIDFNHLAMVGAVLAINADVRGGAVFDGSVAAQSFTGDREFHRHDFDWTPEPAPVNESVSILLFALSFSGLAWRRRFKKT